MPQEKSAGAIIYRKEDNKIYYLLLHYNAGHWEFPKGHIEANESEAKAAVREIEEETGIKRKSIKIIPGFKKYLKYYFRQYKEGVSEEDRRAGKTPLVCKLVVFYVTKTKTKDIVLDLKEHQGFAWLLFGEAVEKTTFKNSKKLLREVNDFVVKHESK